MEGSFVIVQSSIILLLRRKKATGKIKAIDKHTIGMLI